MDRSSWIVSILLGVFILGGYFLFTKGELLPFKDENTGNSDDQSDTHTLTVDANLGGVVHTWVNGENKYQGRGKFEIEKGANIVMDPDPFPEMMVLSIEPEKVFVMDEDKTVTIQFTEKDYF